MRSYSPGRALAERFDAQHQWYQSRISRARNANIITRASPAKNNTQPEAVAVSQPSPPAHARGTELRARLRVLGQKDDLSWSLAQMKAALLAGGYSVSAYETKAQLRVRTKALAAAADARWAAEEEAAAVEAAAAAAAAAVVTANKQTAARKFRSRSRALLRMRGTLDRKDLGATQRGDESSDDEISLTDDEGDAIESSRSQHSSHRASFRQRGATYASARATPMKPSNPSPPAANEVPSAEAVHPMLAALRTLLLPEFANGTPWAAHVGKCLA